MHYEARKSIREFIAPRIPDADWSDDDDIFALGLVNSLFAMELVLFLEKCFEMSIPNEELDLENFRSVEAMTQLIGKLHPAAEAAGS